MNYGNIFKNIPPASSEWSSMSYNTDYICLNLIDSFGNNWKEIRKQISSFHSHLARRGLNPFQQFCGRRKGVWRIVLEVDWVVKMWSIFGGRFRFFRESDYKFYSTTLTWPIIYIQTERCYITGYFSFLFLAYFVVISFLILSICSFLLIAYLSRKCIISSTNKYYNI